MVDVQLFRLIYENTPQKNHTNISHGALDFGRMLTLQTTEPLRQRGIDVNTSRVYNGAKECR